MSETSQEMIDALTASDAAHDAGALKAAASAYVESWKTGDEAARAALFAADAILEDPVGGPVLTGLDDIRAFWRLAPDAGVKTEPTLKRVIACGSEAFINFEIKLTNPDGSVQIMDIYEVIEFNEAGKISRMRAFWDADCIRAG